MRFHTPQVIGFCMPISFKFKQNAMELLFVSSCSVKIEKFVKLQITTYISFHGNIVIILDPFLFMWLWIFALLLFFFYSSKSLNG